MDNLPKNAPSMNRNIFLESLAKKPSLIWNKRVEDTKLEKFKRMIEKKYGQKFGSYKDFHKWSVTNYIDLWKELWDYFHLTTSKPYRKVLVKSGPDFLDNDWFIGARFNFAENMMRIRDNRLGLICEDEFMVRETFTFAEIFEEVKVYAAAFKKHGLQVGDRVGCYMSNRKEALFAMLATTSIGAIWGGVIPYYGARPAATIMGLLDPKFIITMDWFTVEGDSFHPLGNIDTISKSCPNLEKVVIVTKRKEPCDVSTIPKGVLMADFLQTGRRPDGTVPELVFTQLPFNHPTIINFTSGTTGLPKGVVHSAGAIIAQMRDFDLHLNLKEGDVVYNHNPVGWAAWDYQIPSLPLGVTQFLFEGSPEYDKKGVTIWENFSRNKVTYAFIATAYMDTLEQQNIVPAQGCGCSHINEDEISAQTRKQGERVLFSSGGPSGGGPSGEYISHTPRR